MKQHIDPFAYAPQILNALKKGVLLTVKSGEKINTMTIGWAHLGIEWNMPTFIAYVRGCRHTKPMLDEAMEFTVNIPLEEADKNVIRVCGTKSGRDLDKIRELGLTLEEPEKIQTPGIKELPLTLECKVVYRQQQEPSLVHDDHIFTHYQHPCHDIEQDYHTVYYGQIVSAYIIQ
jgi:flavin reductase (DIM6/NTAB) family NADH-FMN oxidoreductase RutF